MPARKSPADLAPLPTPDEARRTRGPLGTAALVLFALTGALAILVPAGRLSRQLEPVEYQRLTTEKFAFLHDHRDEIDLYFVGSSRVLRGVDPTVVDDKLAELGCGGVTSFNFGRGGMSAPMLVSLLRAIAERPGGRPALVLAEPRTAYGPALTHPGHAAARYANRLSTLVLGLIQVQLFRPPDNRADLASPESLEWLGENADRAYLTWRYAKTFASSWLGIGTLQRRLLPPPRDDRAVHAGLQRSGFFSLDDELAAAAPENRAQFEKRRYRDKPGKLRMLEDRVRTMVRSEGKVSAPLGALERHYVTEIIEAARSNDTEAGILLMPVSQPWEHRWNRRVASHLAETTPDLPVLLLEPSEHPGLFDADFWFDGTHLSAVGAERYSAWLATRLCGKHLPREPRP